MSDSIAELDRLVASLQGKYVRTCTKCGIRDATNRSGRARCTECAAESKRKASESQDRNRKGTAERGYGTEHRRERKRWLLKVEAGNCFCWRCGEWVNPDEPWDLGHDDEDRSKYRGPEHQACNRATMTHAAERRSEPVQARRNSRQW